MADPQVQQVQTPSEPSMKDLLDLYRKDIFLNFSCHHVAKIQTFNSAKQTATATINYKQTVFEPNATGVNVRKLVDYPILLDCPVLCLGGGNGALTFPIAPGDDCLALFNDRSIDTWFQGSTTSAPPSGRLHSLSDGIILVGLRSMADVLPSYNGTDVELRNKAGTTKIAIAGDGSYIKGTIGPTMTFEFDATGKFKITNASGEFIASLLNMLETAVTTTIFGQQPLIFNPVLQAIVDSFKA